MKKILTQNYGIEVIFEEEEEEKVTLSSNALEISLSVLSNEATLFAGQGPFE